MKKYLAIGLLGVGCIYAATSLFSFSHFFHNNSRCDQGKNESMINFDNAFNSENLIDIAIIGSGPAGLMASVYGCRAGRHVVCFEGAEPGGLLTKTTLVENWPGEKSIMGPDIVSRIREQAAELGAYFVADTVIKTDFSSYPYRLETADGVVVHALSVIIATGATPKTLGIPGEDLFWGSGVTTCAVCDGRFYKDKDVVVVGGGDSAVEEAIQLTPHARSITIMVRGKSMRAASTMQERLKQYSNITIRYNVSLQEIVGQETVFEDRIIHEVTGMKVRDNVTGLVTQEPIDGVFLAIGHEPNVGMLDNQVALRDTGHIALQGRTQQTSVSGVLAAGDVSDNEYRQAGVAAGDGIKAALDADRFLAGFGYSPAVALELDEVRFYPSLRGVDNLIKPLETVEQYDSLINAGSGLALIDFYAEDCPACMYMLSSIRWVATYYADLVAVYTVDIDALPALAKSVKVSKVPTLLIYKNGLLVDTVTNPLKRSELIALIDKYIQ